MIDNFWGPNRFLSNFYPCVVEFEDSLYSSVEHAFQAAKSLDPLVRLQARKIVLPGNVKKFGRTIDLRPDWEEVKFWIMRSLVYKKFEDDELAEKLLATGDEELIEGNTWGDTYWGVYNGKGQNNLGKILMEVRATTREDWFK